jgi:phosphoenolpyruvate-protein phosphotransferase
MWPEIQLPVAVSALAISSGIAVGPVFLHKVTMKATTTTKISSEQIETELQHLQSALAAATQELTGLSKRVAQKVGRNEAGIFEAQQLMLEDPDLLAEVHQRITQQHYTAAAALQEAAEHYAQELEMLDNEILAARGTDIRDATARVIHYLIGEERTEPALSHPVILVAYDLTPSDTANLDHKYILGICTVTGGFTTHAAIIARSLEIPAIAGINPQLLDELEEGEQIAIDGTQGLLYRHLGDEQQHMLSTAMQQRQEQRTISRVQNEARWRACPASSADGIAVKVFANVGDGESARTAGEAGAEGIGLLRTEFLFGGRPTFPDEQEQFESYVALFRAFAEHATLGKTIVARTLDAGADKPFPALEPLIGVLNEANPALGLRGIRIHLVHEELLRQQLRALLRASIQADIHLHIMFPMIATLEEVRHVRAIYTSVCRELTSAGSTPAANTQIGIMIETPAAAFMADVLVREVDFFSIGANDLFQYTMAADRTNSRVTSMFGILEPAVWRLIAHVVQAGATHGKTVSVCGELAADPRIGPALAGLGVQELSMNPPAIVRVKAALHSQPMGYWQNLARELLTAETAEDMQRLLHT